MRLHPGVYIVPTDDWYIERTVWLVAGIVLLAATALAVTYHPLWILVVIATAWASIAVSVTGFCVVGNVLRFNGFPGPARGSASDPLEPLFHAN